MNVTLWIAALITTISISFFITQPADTVKTKNTIGVPLGVYLFWVTGIYMRLVYSIFLKDLPFIMVYKATMP